ncbi:uncharacterized protein LOC143289206 isoform X2 [Babylonia areolata]|uniref:uncharacterized protein LOC143289206 isoform X2 n=1 Tax=Babylonia areolata TaxID=304850 RepID=UPI003FD0BEE7
MLRNRLPVVQMMDGARTQFFQLYNYTKDAAGNAKEKVNTANPKVKTAGCVAVGLATAVAAPYVAGTALSAIGFTKTGVAAGSVATTMMSKAWTLGYGTAAVSGMQSAGAAGVGATASIVAGWLGYKAAKKVSGSGQELKPKL